LIDYLHAQMKANLWRRTHQGIAFDTNGRLIDGQHRMWAIVESGCTVWIYVSRGINPEDVVVIDTGISKTYSDHAHYREGWNTDPVVVAIARILVLGPSGRQRRIPSEVLNGWYEHYKDAIDFATKLRLQCRPSTGKSITVPMAAAFARAWFSCDRTALSRFGEIIRTGQYQFEADRAAFTLRDAWLSGRLGTVASEQYLKTEGAIRAFCERRGTRTLQQPHDEVFPTIPALPKDKKYTPVQTSAHSKRALAKKKVPA